MAALLRHIRGTQGETAAKLLFHGQVVVDGARILEAFEGIEGQPVIGRADGRGWRRHCGGRERIRDAHGAVWVDEGHVDVGGWIGGRERGIKRHRSEERRAV